MSIGLPSLPLGGRMNYHVMSCPRDGCGEPVSLAPNQALMLPGTKPPWCHEVWDYTPGKPPKCVRRGNERV